MGNNAINSNKGGNGLEISNVKLIVESAEVRNEINTLMKSLSSNNKLDFTFKNVSSKIFYKMSSHLPLIPPNYELLFCIATHGVFVQNSTKICYLQMVVTEVTFKPITLLGTNCWTPKAKFPWNLINDNNVKEAEASEKL